MFSTSGAESKTSCFVAFTRWWHWGTKSDIYDCLVRLVIVFSTMSRVGWRKSVKLVCVCLCVAVYQVSEMAVSELPGNPNAVWTVKRNTEGEPACLQIQGVMELRLIFVPI